MRSFLKCGSSGCIQRGAALCIWLGLYPVSYLATYTPPVTISGVGLYHGGEHGEGMQYSLPFHLAYLYKVLGDRKDIGI